jgi:hypothetical protein
MHDKCVRNSRQYGENYRYDAMRCYAMLCYAMLYGTNTTALTSLFTAVLKNALNVPGVGVHWYGKLEAKNVCDVLYTIPNPNANVNPNPNSNRRVEKWLIIQLHRITSVNCVVE